MSKSVRIGMLVLALAGSGLSPAAASGSPLRAGAVKKLLTNPPVADGELAAIRGGFFTAAGAQFDFGATVTTTVNGQLALQTNLTWTPGGAAIQQLSGLGAAIQSQVAGQVAGLGDTIRSQVASDLAKGGITNPVTPNAAATVQTMPTTASAATAVAPAPTVQTVQTVPTTITAAPSIAPAASPSPASPASVSTPTNIAANVAPTAAAAVSTPAAMAAAPVPAAPDLSGASTAATSVSPTPEPSTVATITNIVPSSSASGSNAAPTILTGVQLQSATGTTQVLSNIGANQLQNILINSASNQQIVQNMNVIFTIYNFADWQKQLSQNAVSAQLANEIMAAAGLR